MTYEIDPDIDQEYPREQEDGPGSQAILNGHLVSEEDPLPPFIESYDGLGKEVEEDSPDDRNYPDYSKPDHFSPPASSAGRRPPHRWFTEEVKEATSSNLRLLFIFPRNTFLP